MSERRVFEFDPVNPEGFVEVRDKPVPTLDQTQEAQEVKPEADNVVKVEAAQPEPAEESTTEAVESQAQEAETEEGVEVETEGEEGSGVEPVGESGVQAESSEQEEQTEDVEAEPEEEPVTDNFYLAAASAMRERGELPDDFELDTNLSEDEAADKIYNTYLETLKKDAHTELFQEFQSEVSKRGWDEQTLQYASLLKSGVSAEDIARSVNYETLSNADVDKMSSEDKVDYIKAMYEDQNYKQEDIKRILTSLEIDEDYDPVIETAKEHFANRKKEVDELNNRNALQQQQYVQQVQQYKQSVVSEVFNKREIGGEKLTEEQLDKLESAIYERTVPVQHDGKVYNLTPFEQFEYALNNDFGLKVYMFKKWLFREEDVAEIKKEAEKTAELNHLKKWGKRVKQVKSPSVKQQAKDQNTIQVPEGGTSYIMESDGFRQI